MKLLTVDSSSSVCSVALSLDDQPIAEQVLNLAGPQSSRLSDLIDRVLQSVQWQLDELDGFGVSLGPGAFTSLRVGLATVKGLALATGKPVTPFSSLALLAAQLPWTDLPVCPLFDARKGEVYAGLYRCVPTPVALQPDSVTSPEKFLATLTGPVLFLGDGAERYRPLIQDALGDRARFAPAWANIPRAAAAAAMTFANIAHGLGVTPAALVPTYLRKSEAEVARQSLLGRTI